MNKQELVESVAAKSGLTKAQASQSIAAVFDSITEALVNGEEIRLTGFGTFYSARREATTGRNPRTGTPIEIKASTQAKFRPGKGLKDSVKDSMPKQKVAA